MQRNRMINRENWKAINKYLQYRSEVDQISVESVRLEKGWLRHLLEWAKDESFSNAPKIRPTFPEFILSSRLDGDNKPLSKSFIKKTISSARRFLEWLSIHESGYRLITQAWLATLKAPRMPEKPREHEIVTMDEIHAIAAAPDVETWEKRIKAAAVFWYLSGIRIKAFVTLPLLAVDIKQRSIKQFPSLGVHTKNQKHAVTFLLLIPELLEVVHEWDAYVRSICPEESFWFAPISPETMQINPDGHHTAGKHRDCKARKDLKRWLEKVNLPYHSPHKFRHGNAVYGIKHAADIGDFKAISQNLMHSNLSITDGIYGGLSNEDVQHRIDNLGVLHGLQERRSKEEIKAQLLQIISEL